MFLIIDFKLTRKAELEAEAVEIEKRLKNQMVMQEKLREEELFNREKGKLDKALAMGVISDEEYQEKLMQLELE